VPFWHLFSSHYITFIGQNVEIIFLNSVICLFSISLLALLIVMSHCSAFYSWAPRVSSSHFSAEVCMSRAFLLTLTEFWSIGSTQSSLIGPLGWKFISIRICNQKLEIFVQFKDWEICMQEVNIGLGFSGFCDIQGRGTALKFFPLPCSLSPSYVHSRSV
jgi:hypothetical protein